MSNRHRRVRRVLSGSLVCLVLIAPLGRTSGAAATAASGLPVAQPLLGDPTVAAVFREGLAAGHECTASVVRSPRRNVLIGAAHCFAGDSRGVQVAPGYHNGLTPYGIWTVTAAYVDHDWTAHQNPERDWVFLVVAPQQRHGRMTQIQDVTGANLPLFSLADGQQVTVPAYPAGINDTAITCTTSSYHFQGYGAFDCEGYVGGTSGSPWLVSTPVGRAVAGVIGGLHQGGCVSSTSYSAVLGLPAWLAYLRASFGARADVLPAPGGDGC